MSGEHFPRVECQIHKRGPLVSRKINDLNEKVGFGEVKGVLPNTLHRLKNAIDGDATDVLVQQGPVKLTKRLDGAPMKILRKVLHKNTGRSTK
jgi:hypothetical protein